MRGGLCVLPSMQWEPREFDRCMIELLLEQGEILVPFRLRVVFYVFVVLLTRALSSVPIKFRKKDSSPWSALKGSTGCPVPQMPCKAPFTHTPLPSPLNCPPTTPPNPPDWLWYLPAGRTSWEERISGRSCMGLWTLRRKWGAGYLLFIASDISGCT